LLTITQLGVNKVKELFIRLLKLLRLYSTAKAIRRWMDRYAPENIRRRKEMLAFYSQFIKKGDLCFDVGANMGNRTEIFLELGARVVCIEPQKVCLQRLYKLFGNNKDVIIVDKAVGDREGYAELAICEEAPTLATLSDKWKKEGRFSKDFKWEKTQRVPVTTLDTLVLLYGLPIFCKIDVEGFEESVLKGLTKPLPFISFEFTREFFDDAKKCVNHLLSIGRVEFNCSIGESMKWLFPTWVTPDELYQGVDSVEDKLVWAIFMPDFSDEENGRGFYYHPNRTGLAGGLFINSHAFSYNATRSC